MKILFDFISLALSKVINTPLLLIETALLARLLGTVDFGKYSLVVASSVILHSAFLNWSNAITDRFGCEEWLNTKSMSKTFSIRLPIICVGLFISAGLLIFSPFNWVQNIYLLSNKMIVLVILCLLSNFFMFETQSMFQSTSNFKKISFFNPVISFIGVMVLFIEYFMKYQNFLGVITIYFSIKVIFWSGLFLYGLRKFRCFPLKIPYLNEFKEALFYVWPLMPLFVITYLAGWGTHIILARFCTLEEVGIWAASYQVFLGVVSLNSIFVPVLLRWLIAETKNNNEIPKKYVENILPALISLWMFILIFIVALLPYFILMFFGKRFEKANEILAILSIPIFTSLFSSFYSPLFTLQNRLKKTLQFNGIIVCVNLVVSLIFIPWLKDIGAAISLVIAFFTGHIFYIVDQHKYIGVRYRDIYSLFYFGVLIGFLNWYTVDAYWYQTVIFLSISLIGLVLMIRNNNLIKREFIDRFSVGILSMIAKVMNKFLIKESYYED